jgi:GxxExxY protein
MSHQFEELSSRFLAAAVDVHKALGPGFLESIYQKAMEVALEHRGISFSRQAEVMVYFEEVPVGLQRLDLVVDAQIIVELKAIKASRIFISPSCDPTLKQRAYTSDYF